MDEDEMYETIKNVINGMRAYGFLLKLREMNRLGYLDGYLDEEMVEILDKCGDWSEI